MKIKSLFKLLPVILSLPVLISCTPANANQRTNLPNTKPARENKILEYNGKVYYLNNADDFLLYCDNDGNKEIIIDENSIHNYSVFNDLIFYSTINGLFLTDIQNKDTVQLLDKKSTITYKCYNSFQYYDNSIFFSYFDNAEKQNIYYLYDLNSKELNEIGASNIIYDEPLQLIWHDFGIVHYDPTGIIHVLPTGIIKEEMNINSKYIFQVAEDEMILIHSYYNDMVYVLIKDKTNNTYRYVCIDLSRNVLVQSKEIEISGDFVFLNGQLYCYSYYKISRINVDGTVEDIVTGLDNFISSRHMIKMYAGIKNIYFYTTHMYNTESYSIWSISPNDKSYFPIIDAVDDETDALLDGAKGIK